MPSQPRAADAFLVAAEDNDRANARVVDKIMLALPRELDGEQRAALVRSFAEKVTAGKAPWLAAFHDQGKDALNPHCHLVIRDRDPETGRRVAGMSEVGSTNRLRTLWEEHANAALEQAGREERIDHRSLAAQGIERTPTIHEGPNARAMEARGVEPVSSVRELRNGPGAKSPSRTVDYAEIDQGCGRVDYNRGVREIDADGWAAFDAAQQAAELADLRKIHHPPTSVDGIGRLVAGSIESDLPDHTVPGAHVVGGLPGAFFAPGRAAGIIPGPSGLKPAAEGIVRRQGNDKLPDALGKIYNSAPYLSQYDQNIDNNAREYKSMDQDDEIYKKQLEEAKFRAANDKARHDGLMERSYLDPGAAEKSMDKYRAKNGNQGLYDKLSDRTAQRSPLFGRRPGSIGSADGFRPGAHDRRQDSHIARQDLPSAVRNHHQSQGRLADAQRAHDNALGPTPGAGSGKAAGPGPSGGSPAGGVGAAQPSARREPAWKNPQAHGYERTPPEFIPKEKAPAQQKSPPSSGERQSPALPGTAHGHTKPQGEHSPQSPGAPHAKEPEKGPAKSPSFSERMAPRPAPDKAVEPKHGYNHNMPDDWKNRSPAERQAGQHHLMEKAGQPPPAKKDTPAKQAPAKGPSFSERLAAPKSPDKSPQQPKRKPAREEGLEP